MDKKTITIVFPLVLSLALASGVGAAGCNLVSGKTYYSDGVSFFSDSACHQEMTNAGLNAGAPASVISAGNGNCRYDSSRQQFTDGVSFFVDNKCANEALNGETVPNVSASLAAATAPVSTVGTSQLAQLSQRIDTLEKRMVSLQSILVQLLALLSSR